MHHFVVRQRVHEPLAVLVHHGKRELVMRPFSEKGIDPEIVEGVMHPPHVPLQGKAEPALVDRMGDLGPRRALFRNRDHTGVQRVHRLIQLLEKRHRVEILTPTKPVAQPLPRLAAVVEVEHRGDGIHTQPVDVELLDPVQGVRKQKVAHFMARIVEDVGTPFRVITQSGIFMLVARRAIEAPQRPVVLRKVGRYPIEQHTDPRGMHRIHKAAELIGRAVT